jgi:ADP-heptose:LPS heptosyltransferase
MNNEERFFYEYIVISRAIGDFIAFESFLTDKEKINLKEVIYLGSNKKFPHFECIEKSKFYNNNCKKTIIKRPHKINQVEFKNNLINSYFYENQEINKDKVLIDWNFYEGKHEKLLRNQNLKNYSFIKEKLCEIDKFKLPQEYISISAWTYSRTKKRVFNIGDWHETIKILKLNNIKGVILNNQKWYLDNLWFKEILKEDCFINLTGETNYFEAIEIVKNSKGFIGIDGSLSVIATQVLQEKSIMIKANADSGAHRFFNYYYSNLKTKNCLVEQIKLNKFNI